MRLVPPWRYETPLCKNLGVNYYYLEEDTGSLDNNIKKEIKKLCNSCSHQSDCANWGLNKEIWGIWGGLTASERRHIRNYKGIKLS
jgi:hypothetical protein